MSVKPAPVWVLVVKGTELLGGVEPTLHGSSYTGLFVGCKAVTPTVLAWKQPSLHAFFSAPLEDERRGEEGRWCLEKAPSLPWRIPLILRVTPSLVLAGTFLAETPPASVTLLIGATRDPHLGAHRQSHPAKEGSADLPLALSLCFLKGHS